MRQGTSTNPPGASSPDSEYRHPASEPPVEGLTSKTATKPGHTPGPWVALEDEKGWKVQSDAFSDETPGICGDHSKHWRLVEEDARLIATAPLLLERLKARRGNCRCEGEECHRCQADDAAIRAAEPRS